MKKFLLLTFIASLFAAGSAFAHCGACGASEEAHDHAATAEKACCGTEAGKCCSDKAAKADCTKSDCSKSDCAKSECAKSDCKKSCCGTEGKCCSSKKAECGSECAKPCCTKAEAEDETAVAAPPACCPASKSGKPA